MKKAAIACAAAVALLVGIWAVVIPDRLITGAVSELLERNGLQADLSTFRKGIFFDFSADRIAISRAERELIVISSVSGRFNPLKLLLLRLDVGFSGTVGNGLLSGSVTLRRGGSSVQLKLAGAEVSAIPFFKGIGLAGSGELSGQMATAGGSGDIRFEVTNARLGDATYGGVTVPLDIFHTARGALTLKGPALTVTSFALEGDGLYARIKGSITAGVMNLSMEIMPEKALVEKRPALLLLERYRTSPGHYAVPLSGPLTP